MLLCLPEIVHLSGIYAPLRSEGELGKTGYPVTLVILGIEILDLSAHRILSIELVLGIGNEDIGYVGALLITVARAPLLT